MSAFVVSKEHVALLAGFADRSHMGGTICSRHNLTTVQLANALLAENVRSVNYRYESSFPPEEPEVVGFPDINKAYQALMQLGDRALVQVIKACHCLEYQSCEHPEWEASQAKRILGEIESAAIHSLPGYDDAAWEVTEGATR